MVHVYTFKAQTQDFFALSQYNLLPATWQM